MSERMIEQSIFPGGTQIVTVKATTDGQPRPRWIVRCSRPGHADESLTFASRRGAEECHGRLWEREFANIPITGYLANPKIDSAR